MKILHLLASPYFTGPAEAVTQLALAQRALGHDVTIAIDRKRTTNTSEELAVPRLEPLQLLSPLPLELSVKSTPFGMLRDVMTLRSSQADVVHSHFSHDHTLLRLGRPRGAVVVRSFHAPRSVRWATPAADGFTVPMDALARKLLGHKVMVLPALVAAEFVPANDRAALRRELGLPASPLIGMVSTFQSSRRHALALEAFARRTDGAHLVLIGDGPLEAELRAKAGDRVHFAGYQSGAAFVKHLQALDEVWVLGLGNDWSARAAAQARACGVRVVAVDEGALAQHADVLVEPTVEALLSAPQTRLATTPEPPAAIAARVIDFYARCRE